MRICLLLWVYYRDYGNYPENMEKLERILGPIRNEGYDIAQAVITSKVTVAPCR